MRQYLPLAFTSKYMPAPSAYLSPVALPLCLVLFLMNVSFSATVSPLAVSGLAVLEIPSEVPSKDGDAMMPFDTG